MLPWEYDRKAQVSIAGRNPSRPSGLHTSGIGLLSRPPSWPLSNLLGKSTLQATQKEEEHEQPLLQQAIAENIAEEIPESVAARDSKPENASNHLFTPTRLHEAYF